VSGETANSPSALTVDALKELIEQRLSASDAALVLAAAEIARRLADLNGAHALAEQVLHTYTPRELMQKNLDLISEKIKKQGEGIDRRLVLLEGVSAQRTGIERRAGEGRNTALWLIGLALTVAVGLLAIFLRN